MSNHARITKMIFEAIEDVNENLDPEQRLPKSPATPLMGESASLNSLHFLTLLSSIEENIEETFTRVLNLFDIVALGADQTWTVDDFAQRIVELLETEA